MNFDQAKDLILAALVGSSYLWLTKEVRKLTNFVVKHDERSRSHERRLDINDKRLDRLEWGKIKNG